MKKFWMMLLAAATLAGCQKSEEMTISTGDTISLTAEMSQPETGRTALVENEGVYSAIWTSGDKLTLFELADGAFSLYESNALTADAATASFTFDGVAAKEAASFRYVAGTNIASNCTVNNLRLELPAEQAPATMTTFDGAADILLSLPIDRTTQPVSEALTFTTARVSTVVKLAIKNLALADGEKVEQVVFSCEQPIAGKFQVGVKDLAADTYPIPFSWRDEGYSISITLPEPQSGDFVTYFSCLPTTLKVNEGYTVTVKTNRAAYHKVATLAADLTLTAGDITAVTVNMGGDAATKTNVLRFNDTYEYVIACKAEDGNTYLMSRNECDRRPAAKSLASLGLSLDESGSLVGLVPDEFRWKAKAVASENEGEYETEFYYTQNGTTYNLIVTSNAQGIAVNLELSGYYDNPYTKTIVVKENGDGYALMNTNATTPYSLYVFKATDFRFTEEASNQDVVYFCRIQDAPQKSLYPVITKANAVTPGTYAVLYNGANGYFALPNTTTISGTEGAYNNTLPTATPIADIAMTIDESGMVTSATVADTYKWVLTPYGSTEKWSIRSAVNLTHFLYSRNNGGSGVAIGVADQVTAVNANFTNDWTFLDDSAKGMQGQTSGNPRYLYINESSSKWAMANGMGTGLILVKLSDSTEQIASNE